MCTIYKFPRPKIPIGSLFHMHVNWYSHVNINLFMHEKYFPCSSSSALSFLRSNKCPNVLHCSMLISWSMLDRNLLSISLQPFAENYSSLVRFEDWRLYISFRSSSMPSTLHLVIIENWPYQIFLLVIIFVELVYIFIHKYFH